MENLKLAVAGVFFALSWGILIASCVLIAKRTAEAEKVRADAERARARGEAYRQAYLAERRDVQQRVDRAVEDALDEGR